MTSVHSSSLDADEVDLSGLVESVVDSDEEDLAESMDVRTISAIFIAQFSHKIDNIITIGVIFSF